MFGVTVVFDLHPGMGAAFLPHMMENARASRAEAACRRFDVLYNPYRPDQVFLYELYENEAGFEAHLQMPHFLQFSEKVASMVAAREISRWDQVAVL